MALVPPLDLSAFDFTPTKPYFHSAMQDDLDRIDGMDKTLADIEKPLWLIDVVQIGVDLLTPITTASDALTDFENHDFTTDTDTIIKAGPAIDTSFVNNETTAGKISTAGNKINVQGQTINGVAGSAPATTPTPAPAPKLPPIGSATGPYLAGAQAFITNVNRPGDPGHYHVGDPWQITVKAPAGTSIYAVASHDGVSLGQASFGTVPNSGILLIGGKFTAAELGSWIENWYSGSNLITQIVFEVK